MQAYVDEVRKMQRHFDGLEMKHIPRAQKYIADELSKWAAQKARVAPGIFVQKLTQPTVTPTQRKAKKLKACRSKEGKAFPGELPSSNPGKTVPVKHEVLAVEPRAPTWAANLVHCLQEDELPDNRKEAEKVARQAKMYVLIDGDLFRRRPNGVKLR